MACHPSCRATHGLWAPGLLLRLNTLSPALPHDLTSQHGLLAEARTPCPGRRARVAMTTLPAATAYHGLHCLLCGLGGCTLACFEGSWDQAAACSLGAALERECCGAHKRICGCTSDSCTWAFFFWWRHAAPCCWAAQRQATGRAVCPVGNMINGACRVTAALADCWPWALLVVVNRAAPSDVRSAKDAGGTMRAHRCRRAQNKRSRPAGHLSAGEGLGEGPMLPHCCSRPPRRPLCGRTSCCMHECRRRLDRKRPRGLPKL